MFKVILEKAQEPEIKLPTFVGLSKNKDSFRKKNVFVLYWLCHSLWLCGKFLKRWEYQTNLACFLRNQYADQTATVKTGHGTTGWFKLDKGVRQSYIFSPCLFNLYAEYIMRNAGLEEAQTGIKIAGRNISNFTYTDDTTLMAESKELNSLLMKVKEEWKNWLKIQHSEN